MGRGTSVSLLGILVGGLLILGGYLDGRVNLGEWFRHDCGVWWQEAVSLLVGALVYRIAR